MKGTMATTENDALAAKIREALERTGLEKARVADAIGVSKQSVTGWEDTGRITKSNLAKLAKLAGVKIEWFYPSEVEIPSSGDISHTDKYGKLNVLSGRRDKFDKNVTPSFIGKRAIPVISAIQAGALKEITDPYEAGDGFATLYTDDDYSQWAFALEIEGDSMLPEFRPGDRVIIEPDWIPRPGEYVAAKNGNDEATFKKYRERGIDTNGNMIFELVPLNDDYPTLRSDVTPLIIIGVMAEHRKKSRR